MQEYHGVDMVRGQRMEALGRLDKRGMEIVNYFVISLFPCFVLL